MNEFFEEVKFFRFWPKTMAHGFVFGSPKKVWRKVCNLKEHEKKNLMVLVSVA